MVPTAAAPSWGGSLFFAQWLSAASTASTGGVPKVARPVTAQLTCHCSPVDPPATPTPAGGFTVATAGSPADTLPFDAVVLALPLQHLTRIGSDDDTLAAALAAHCGQFDHPAHYLRVTALFDEPFWQGRIDGGYLMLDAFGGCCLYDESARDPEPRHGVLGWLLGGSAAETWAARDRPPPPGGSHDSSALVLRRGLSFR